MIRLCKRDLWIIMSKDEKLVACGNVRDRRLIDVEDIKSGKFTGRILTYGSKGKAEAGFKVSGFYDMPWEWRDDRKKYLKAVNIEQVYTIK